MLVNGLPARMYFVAVLLPSPLNEKVLHYKNYMHEKYSCKVGLKSPAHITIAPPFWMEEETEPRLLHDVEQIAASSAAFHLATNNFSAFKPRTIFVAVEKSEALQALKRAADDFFRGAPYKVKVENRPFHPHITIATRDLFKKDFADAWPYFETQKFQESFSATGLSVLRHNGRTWDVISTAPFTAPSTTGLATQR